MKAKRSVGPRSKKSSARHSGKLPGPLRGKLKPIVDLVAKRRKKKSQAKHAEPSISPPASSSMNGSHAPFERPTTANLIRRNIESDADVAEALSRVEQAQKQMEQLRSASDRVGAGRTASKYLSTSRSSTTGREADILVIHP